jgi:hypothetical protein
LIAPPIDYLIFSCLALSPLGTEPYRERGITGFDIAFTGGFIEATLFCLIGFATISSSIAGYYPLISSSSYFCFFGAIYGIFEGGRLVLFRLEYAEEELCLLTAIPPPSVLLVLIMSIFFLRRLNLDCMVVPTGPTKVPSPPLSCLESEEGKRFSFSFMIICSGIS